VWLSFGQAGPYEDHGRAGCRGKDDKACNVRIDLVGRQVRAEKPADEQPCKKRHRERLDGPVDEQRDADAPPVPTDLPKRGEVDFQKHGNNHQPDENGDGNIDLGNLGGADSVEQCREKMPQSDARDNAKGNPDSQIPFKDRHQRCSTCLSMSA